MGELLEIAKEIEFNAKAEAQAVLDYTELLRQINNSNLENVDKKFLIDNIEEIIADELNHQQRLEMAYTMLTKIKANKN